MKLYRIFCTLVLFIGLASSVHAQFIISDFDGTGFDWLCCGFSQEVGPAHVTLRSDDGWGLADIRTRPTDVSSMIEDRFQIRVRMNQNNTAENLSLGLVDPQGNEAKWWFDVAGQATPGGWSTLTAWQPISDPSSGTGDWQNIDLENITSFRVLGHWQHPGPFDMSIDQISIIPNGTYPGEANNAAWRAVAATRIDEIRKADLKINVTDRAGAPLPHAKVKIQMVDHEFGFGSAVQAHRLRSRGAGPNATYREKVEELFNITTIENNLKWVPWEGEWGGQFTHVGAERAVSWLNERDIEVRGHNLIWPSHSHLPDEAQTLLDRQPLSSREQTELRDLINVHIQEVAGSFAGQLSAWDVINEPRVNHDVMDALDIGDAVMVEWFEQTRAADPDATLYLNDYGILSGGNSDSRNQEIYFETIEYLKSQGAPIEGIGFQSHFRETSLTGPEQIWEILDRFEELGLEMQITEFDFDTRDEALQAKYTRDFMTAIFAHPGMDDFVMWGFQEDAHWRPAAAMYRSDWSVKPNGDVYDQLVFDDWWTDEELLTDDAGNSALRAFKGGYQITVIHDGVEQTLETQLGDDLSLNVQLDAFARGTGDFNEDGIVDAKDIDLLSIQTGIETLSADVIELFDLNGDMALDSADHDLLVYDIIQATAGDVDLNGSVQFLDFSVLADKFGDKGGWGDGDFNGDGVVQFSDFAMLAKNYGHAAVVVDVPEPSGVVLLMLAGIGMLFAALRTRKQ